jgi:hypothetical protein
MGLALQSAYPFEYNKMNIGYTVRNGQIEIAESPQTIHNDRFEVHIEKKCVPLSVMRMSGEMQGDYDVYFAPSVKQGIVACIQWVNNRRMLQFNSSTCNEMNYYTDILEVRFFSSDITFRHKYTEGSVINRLDIFFPLKSAEMLHHQIIYPILHHEQLSVDARHLKPIAKKMRNILAEIASQNDKEFCSNVDEIIQLLNQIYS